MTQEIKTAIKSAEKRLEDEQQERLTNEVHEFLRDELNNIERLKKTKEEIETKLRIHEENIKNVKTGNLEAITRRQEALQQPVIWTYAITNASTSYNWYNNNIAGFLYESPLTGKKYIF